jgi:hypothetical protein
LCWRETAAPLGDLRYPPTPAHDLATPIAKAQAAALGSSATAPRQRAPAPRWTLPPALAVSRIDYGSSCATPPLVRSPAAHDHHRRVQRIERRGRRALTSTQENAAGVAAAAGEGGPASRSTSRRGQRARSIAMLPRTARRSE